MVGTVQPEVRRSSDPRVVRKLHFAIKKTCEQKQAPIFERVFRALAIDKVQITRSRVETQLKNSIRDGIILENNSSSYRGKTSGEVKTSYRVPTLENFYENYEDDGHDWYCWVCHREGEVYLCSRCPRVIHKKCAEISTEEITDDFVCYCCVELESTKQYGKKELQELSTMLSYTVERMKSKCEELWRSPTEDQEPTFKLFIYKDTNLNDLEKRVRKKEFDSLAKFHYEIEWLFHNAVIFNGGDNKITNLARMVVLDGQNELSQIDICSECYIRSNERSKDWFCHPCKPIHRIVYAKLGSDPPWPAKVLRENDEGTQLDVRFFGPPYQRAWVQFRNIWELNNKPTNKKRSKALIQAEDELKTYLRLLAKGRNKVPKSSDSDDENGTEEEIEDNDDLEDEDADNADDSYPSRSFTSLSKKKKQPPKNRQDDTDDEDDEEEEEEEEEVEEQDDDDNDDDDDDENDEYDDFEPTSKRKKKKNKKNQKVVNEAPKKPGRGRPRKNENRKPEKPKPRKLKAEKRFRELQEAKLLEFKRNRHKGKGSKDNSMSAVDMNKNLHRKLSNSSDDNADLQFAKQIKMTDDYKMIEKLQERIRQLEKSYDQIKSDSEAAQAEVESSRLDLAAERQKSKKLQEALDKGQEVSTDKIRNEILFKKQDEIDAAVEEERKRNELEFEVRLSEALTEERNLAENKVQEALEKERLQLDSKVKMMTQRDQEEMQRKFERYKSETEMKHNRNMEDTVRKLKIEAEEMTKRTIQENLRRLQVETERVLVNAKKKSWCSNCTKEAFYHCCWNTNYCSIDCQRVHWVTHRYQCTREMMSTCRSCQQRQNFATNLPPQVPPK